MSDVTDTTVSLGDADAHRHDWLPTGVDDNGLHTLTCDCGEEGAGYGDFTDEARALRSDPRGIIAPPNDSAPEAGGQ